MFYSTILNYKNSQILNVEKNPIITLCSLKTLTKLNSSEVGQMPHCGSTVGAVPGSFDAAHVAKQPLHLRMLHCCSYKSGTIFSVRNLT